MRSSGMSSSSFDRRGEDQIVDKSSCDKGVALECSADTKAWWS